jgi:hypothetical protein
MADLAEAATPAQGDASDVTFVVLNWNGRRFLEVVLPSIFKQSAKGFAVHVVDDSGCRGRLQDARLLRPRASRRRR